ncbi:hypothetical protein D918_05748, partial [Trichuris suis]
RVGQEATISCRVVHVVYSARLLYSCFFSDFADRRTTERDDSFPSGVVVPATTQPCSAAALSSSFDTMSRLTNEDDPFDQSSSYDATPSVSNREQMPSANASGSSSAPEVSEKLVSEVCPLCQREVGSQTSMEEHLLCVSEFSCLRFEFGQT